MRYNNGAQRHSNVKYQQMRARGFAKKKSQKYVTMFGDCTISTPICLRLGYALWHHFFITGNTVNYRQNRGGAEFPREFCHF